MDGVIWFALVLIALLAVFRLRLTHRRSARNDRGRQIQEKLQELRKKRDEE